MKNILLIILTILGLVLSFVKLYFMVMPEIVITNSSGINVKVVTVRLPNSKIVFDNILKGESSTIYYTLGQTDGTYKYTIIFESDEIISGECGHITSGEVGKVFHITINNIKKITC